MDAYRLVVSPAARDDLGGIYKFGLQHWGVTQSSNYLEMIKALLFRLTEQPKMGIEREELLPDTRSFAIETHVVFYRLRADQVEIIRILHGRQDPKRHIK
jgi:toxin ParE1/3/4